MLRQIRGMFGGHRPDVEALSARLDGQLAPERERRVDEHVATCAACQMVRDELRQTAAMVGAMPAAEPTRSFRLRASDVAAAPRRTSGYSGGLLRWAPAVSGAAILVLVVTAGVDRATDDGTGGADSLAASREADTPAGMLAADDGASPPGGDAGAAADPDAAEPDRTGPAAEGSGPAADTPGPAAAEGRTNVASDSSTGGPTTTFEIGTASQTEDGTSAAESFAPPLTDITPATGMVPAPGTPETEQAQRLSEDDEDGNQTGFLIVEVMAAIVAIAAAAGYVAWRITRGGIAG